MIRDVEKYIENLNKKEVESWLRVNRIENKENYIEELLIAFGIDKYNFVEGLNGTELQFTLDLDRYRIEIHDGEACLTVMKNNKALNRKQKEKYHLYTRITGVNPWYKLFKSLTTEKRRDKNRRER